MEENLVPGVMGCVFHQVVSLGGGGREGVREGGREEVRMGGGERRKKVVERN